MSNSETIINGYHDALLPLNDDSTVHRYGFKINNFGLTYPTHIASEVVKVMRICSIPHSPKWVHGTINVRGHLIPVFDLNTVLYDLNILLYNKQTTSNLFLVLDKGSAAVAIRINDFPVLLNNAQKEGKIDYNTSYHPPLAIKEYINTYFHTESQAWLELNLVAFFSALKHKGIGVL